MKDWRGPLVGLDNARLVSDTATRLVTHDADGNIIASFWSDGGNSLAKRQPTDMRTSVGLPGVGLTSAGAGVTSFAYLMRVEPENYQVTGWTMWASRYGNKGNGAKITRITSGSDGSMLFAGSSSWGMLQTANHLGDGEPSGPYIGVLSPDMSGVRYASIIPGVGQAEISEGNRWGMFAGEVDGKRYAIFLSGAAADGSTAGLIVPTPTYNGLQEAFAGGLSDGWFAVLDITKTSPEAERPAIRSNPLNYRRAAYNTKKGPKKNKRGFTAEAGMKFLALPDFPRHVTCDAEIRHENSAQYWPNFFYGRPVDGAVTLVPSNYQGPLASLLIVWRMPMVNRIGGYLAKLLALKWRNYRPQQQTSLLQTQRPSRNVHQCSG